MELFKKEKKQPIKLRNFKFIGYHSDYPNCCYYYKELPRDNFELMEMMIEGKKKPEIGAGTKVQILDAFMSNYLYFKGEDDIDFVKMTIDNTYNDLEDTQKEAMLKKFKSKVPAEIERFHDSFKKYIKQGYKVLYCCDDESKDRLMGIVNIVLVKEDNVKSMDPKIDINRTYTLFKPLKYMVRPAYIKGTSSIKYYEDELPLIVVSHDILK